MEKDNKKVFTSCYDFVRNWNEKNRIKIYLPNGKVDYLYPYGKMFI